MFQDGTKTPPGVRRKLGNMIVILLTRARATLREYHALLFAAAYCTITVVVVLPVTVTSLSRTYPGTSKQYGAIRSINYPHRAVNNCGGR